MSKEIKDGRIVSQDIKVLKNYGDEYNYIRHFTNWPVVYIIYNKKTKYAYVGQTTDLKTRLMNHFIDPEKEDLIDDHARVIFIDYDYANGSTCLDLESFLIYNMNRDDKIYQLINGNGGMQSFNYYNKEEFKKFCIDVWNELLNYKIVSSSYKELENNKYVYSPYIALNQEQYYVVKRIIKDLIVNDKETVVVNGCAGTGKSALAIYLLKLLMDYTSNYDGLVKDYMVDFKIDDIVKIANWFRDNNIKIGIIFPMNSIRNIMRKSIKKIINKDVDEFVFSPIEAIEDYLNTNKKFDILIVDEAHRLSYIKSFNFNKALKDKYKRLNKALNFDDRDDINQLEYVYKISKKQVFFYDKKQRIRNGDINTSYFNNYVSGKNSVFRELTIQERCLYGGDEYLDCIKKIFNSKVIFDDNYKKYLKELVNNINKGKKKRYKFVMYNDVGKMHDELKRLFDSDRGKPKGMCYMLSGNCWKPKNDLRNSIDKEFVGLNYRHNEEVYNDYFSEIVKKDACSIEIGDYKNIWNFDGIWVNNEIASRNQVGCIHTISGMDAEYVGVIVGKELIVNNNRYDCIKEEFNDKAKDNTKSKEEVLELILDAYYVLCTRARKGTFLYIYDDNLRSIFSEFMKVVD